MTAGSQDPAAPAAPEATGEGTEAGPQDAVSPQEAVSEDRLLGGRVGLSQPVEG